MMSYTCVVCRRTDLPRWYVHYRCADPLWRRPSCFRPAQSHAKRQTTGYLCHPCYRRELRREKRNSLTCVCGKTFTPVRADARYCSNACRQRAYRMRFKESGAEFHGMQDQ